MKARYIVGLAAALGLGILYVAVWSQDPAPATVTTSRYLEQYVQEYAYEPFAIPRNNWGAGTVVSFDGNRTENIIWRNDECLRFTANSGADGQLADIDIAAVNLPNTSYAIGQDAGLELNLARAIAPEVDLKGAFTDNRVSSIEISIVAPTEAVVSDGAIKRRIRTLAEAGETCVDEIFADNVYVIDRTLGFGELAYAFKTSDQASISMDADLLGKINLAPSAQSRFAGMTSLNTTEARMIGYRLFQYRIEGGLAEGGLVSARIDVAEARRRAGE